MPTSCSLLPDPRTSLVRATHQRSPDGEPRVRATLSRRALLCSAGLVLLPSTGFAAVHSRKVERFERNVPGSDLRAGAARSGVQASRATVRGVITDFAAYAHFIKQFERARVVGHSAEVTDLRLEIPILHGLTKIWAVIRFPPPLREGNALVVRGKMVKGNVKRLDVTWRIEALEPSWTQLTAELVLDLKLPVPRAAVLKTVKRAAAQAVKGARGEAERRAAA